MTEPHTRSEDLKETVVRICPACGVVNPAGPSETCPHLQLARFNGVDDELAELLAAVAEARRRFASRSAELKHRVMGALRDGEAEVETPRKARFSEVENLRARPATSTELTLEHPEPPPSKTKEPRKRARKPIKPPPVDPRQLDLIAQEPAKGDA